MKTKLLRTAQIVLVVFVATSTSSYNTLAENNKAAAHHMKSLSEFKNIKEGESFDDVRKVFGEPKGDIGSGIHIYVYELKDGTTVRIGCVEKVLFVDHVINGSATRLVGKE